MERVEPTCLYYTRYWKTWGVIKIVCADPLEIWLTQKMQPEDTAIILYDLKCEDSKNYLHTSYDAAISAIDEEAEKLLNYYENKKKTLFMRVLEIKRERP